MTTDEHVTVGGLDASIRAATTEGGAYGVHLNPSHPVIVRDAGITKPLALVSVAFIDGDRALVLDTGSDAPR